MTIKKVTEYIYFNNNHSQQLIKKQNIKINRQLEVELQVKYIERQALWKDKVRFTCGV